MGREEILVADMVAGFLEQGYPLYCGAKARDIIPNVVALLRSRQRTNPIYVNDHHQPNDAEFEQFAPHCIAGTEDTELVEELRQFPGDIIPKTKFSAFYGTTLDKVLADRCPTQVILTGVCTDICVMYTAADLRNRGYRVVVPSDCVASFDEQNHRWALKHMANVLGVIVVPSWRVIPAAPEPPVVIPPAPPKPEPRTVEPAITAQPPMEASVLLPAPLAEGAMDIDEQPDSSDFQPAPELGFISDLPPVTAALDSPAMDSTPLTEQPIAEPLPESLTEAAPESPSTEERWPIVVEYADEEQLITSDQESEPPLAEPPAEQPAIASAPEPPSAPAASAAPGSVQLEDTRKILRISPQIWSAPPGNQPPEPSPPQEEGSSERV